MCDQQGAVQAWPVFALMIQASYVQTQMLMLRQQCWLVSDQKKLRQPTRKQAMERAAWRFAVCRLFVEGHECVSVWAESVALRPWCWCVLMQVQRE